MLKNGIFAICAVVIVVSQTVGCSYNHYYPKVTADLKVAGREVIAVATHDQRPFVGARQTGPDYIGMLTRGYAYPIPITTVNSLPLSDDMTRALKLSLSKKGFVPIPVWTSPFESAESVIERLKQTDADKLVLLTINYWRSDTKKRTRFTYDVNLSVFSSNGDPLAESTTAADLSLIRHVGPYGDKNGQAEFKNVLETLFNDPNVIKALTSIQTDLASYK